MNKLFFLTFLFLSLCSCSPDEEAQTTIPTDKETQASTTISTDEETPTPNAAKGRGGTGIESREAGHEKFGERGINKGSGS